MRALCGAQQASTFFASDSRRIPPTARICAYEEKRHFFLKFFDLKSFAIMAVMMSGGIALRSSGLAPERFIAFFYTGLGASLLLAGLLFGCNFGKAAKAAAKSNE